MYPYPYINSSCAICFTLSFRSIRNQSGNFIPILATKPFYSFLQLAVFVFCPFTLASTRSPGRCWDARHHAICYTTDYSFDLGLAWYNYNPNFVTQRLYHTLQLDIFVF
jgi:hypothetical protein